MAPLRMFFAVWLPPAVLDAVDEVALPVTIRRVPRERLHVTLRFLGDVDEARCGDLATTTRRALAGVEESTVTLAGETATFGGRVLMIPVAGLEGVAACIEGAVVAAGLPREARPFAGHLTLARSRGRRQPDLRALAGLPVAADVGSRSWKMDEVSLVRSRLGGPQPGYEVVERFGLGDRACHHGRIDRA